MIYTAIGSIKKAVQNSFHLGNSGLIICITFPEYSGLDEVSAFGIAGSIFALLSFSKLGPAVELS